MLQDLHLCTFLCTLQTCMTFMQICVLFGVNQSAHLLNLALGIFLKVMEKVMESCGISLLKYVQSL